MTDGCPTHVINDDSLQEKCAAKTMAMALYVRSFVRSTAMCVCLLACMSIVHTMFCFVRMYVCKGALLGGSGGARAPLHFCPPRGIHTYDKKIG